MSVNKQVIKISDSVVVQLQTLNRPNGNVNSCVSPPQSAQFCLNYNRNVRALCEFPGNICKFQGIHKCLIFLKCGCESINQSINQSFKSVLPDNLNQNAHGYVATLSGQESNFDSVNVKQGLHRVIQIKLLIKSCMSCNRCQSAWINLSTLLHPPSHPLPLQIPSQLVSSIWLSSYHCSPK